MCGDDKSTLEWLEVRKMGMGLTVALPADEAATAAACVNGMATVPAGTLTLRILLDEDGVVLLVVVVVVGVAMENREAR